MSDSNRARAMQSRARNLSALLILYLCIAALPSFAQETDTVAPIIELEELEDGMADRSQVFTVQIAEDVGLQDATLYYRREGQLSFTPAPMQTLGNTGFYSVSIPTDNSDLRTIEYYVQARDLAGNRTVSGFAFDPYRRTLQPSATSMQQPGSLNETQIGSTTRSPVVTPKAGDRKTTPLLKRRWVQITLGVLAVGVVASLAKDDGHDSRVVPLTFNLQ